LGLWLHIRWPEINAATTGRCRAAERHCRPTRANSGASRHRPGPVYGSGGGAAMAKKSKKDKKKNKKKK
jgi:hypothetical protein